MPKLKIHWITIIFAAVVLALTYGAGIIVKQDTAVAPLFFGLIYLVSFAYFIITIYNLKRLKI